MKRVTALDVRCSTCQAVPGANCRTLTRAGIRPGLVTVPHEPRTRLARQEQARLNPEHVVGQRPLWTGAGPS